MTREAESSNYDPTTGGYGWSPADYLEARHQAEQGLRAEMTTHERHRHDARADENRARSSVASALPLWTRQRAEWEYVVHLDLRLPRGPEVLWKFVKAFLNGLARKARCRRTLEAVIGLEQTNAGAWHAHLGVRGLPAQGDASAVRQLMARLWKKRGRVRVAVHGDAGYALKAAHLERLSQRTWDLH